MPLINGCCDILGCLLNLQGSVSMDSWLNLVFTLLPIFAGCIMLYYQRFYDVDTGVHSGHDEWIGIFDALLSEELRDEVQDYLFIDKGRPNREVNESLGYMREIVSEYKEQIDQLVLDLKDCDGVEGYEDAMLWSRRYAAQQARVQQAELEKDVGVEKAREIMEQAMEAAGIME